MSHMNVVPASVRLESARVNHRMAERRVRSILGQMTFEETLAERQKREVNPELMDNLVAQLRDASQQLADAHSIRIGNEAMAKFPRSRTRRCRSGSPPDVRRHKPRSQHGFRGFPLSTKHFKTIQQHQNT